MAYVEKGDRIRLNRMDNDPAPIEPGAEGTVERVTDLGPYIQVSVRWDNGRGLLLVVPPDEFSVIAKADA